MKEKNLVSPATPELAKETCNLNIFIGEHELTILGALDSWYQNKPVNRFIVKSNEMEYMLQDKDYAMHRHAGYCSYCGFNISRSLHGLDPFCYSIGKLMDDDTMKEIETKLQAHWVTRINESDAYLKYNVIKDYSIMDTFYIIINFINIGEVAGIEFKVDENMHIQFNKIMNSLPENVIKYIKSNIVSELTEEYKLKIIASCSPMSLSLIEHTLINEFDEYKLYSLLATFISTERLDTMPEEEMIKEILELYNQVETTDEIVKYIKDLTCL